MDVHFYVTVFVHVSVDVCYALKLHFSELQVTGEGISSHATFPSPKLPILTFDLHFLLCIYSYIYIKM